MNRSERLLPDEFDSHIKNGTFRLAFIGMSNAGKSFRSRTLQEELGFLWYQVDDEIRKLLDLPAVENLSPWLGYPSSTCYSLREKEYLAKEDELTRHASMKTGGKNLVFDTTGSVVHLSAETLTVLGENCLVVHLDAGENALPAMIDGFFETPKPVAWGDNFDMRDNESEVDALKRCYPALLHKRLGKYRELAHVSIAAEDVRNTSGAETLAIIRKSLEDI